MCAMLWLRYIILLIQQAASKRVVLPKIIASYLYFAKLYVSVITLTCRSAATRSQLLSVSSYVSQVLSLCHGTELGSVTLVKLSSYSCFSM